jgi:hypothetical protein
MEWSHPQVSSFLATAALVQKDFQRKPLVRGGGAAASRIGRQLTSKFDDFLNSGGSFLTENPVRLPPSFSLEKISKLDPFQYFVHVPIKKNRKISLPV